MLSPRWRKVLGPCLRGEEDLLQVRPAHPLQPAPLLDGKEHCGFHTALGHDLRPFDEGGIEELAEPRLGILNRPLLAHALLPITFALASCQPRSNGHQCQGEWANTPRRCGLRALWLERAGVVLVVQHNVDGDLEPLLAVGGLGDVEDGPTSETISKRIEPPSRGRPDLTLKGSLRMRALLGAPLEFAIRGGQ